MPKNAELIEAIKISSKTLEMEPAPAEDLAALSNAQLAEVLKNLNAKIAEADGAKAREELEGSAETDSAAAAALAKLKAGEKPEEEVKRPEFYVAAGKAITTKRGIRSDEDEITADDLAGGKEALAAFVKSGHVKKG